MERPGSWRYGEPNYLPEPGTSSDHYSEFVEQICNLQSNLTVEDEKCSEISALVSQIQNHDQTSVLSDVYISVDRFLSHLEDTRKDHDILQKSQTSLQARVFEAENRSKQLQESLERAAKFDEERLSALQRAQQNRDQLQAELSQSKSSISELLAIQHTHLSDLSSLQSQVAKLNSILDNLRHDHQLLTEANRSISEQNRLGSQQMIELRSSLHHLGQRHDIIERENLHLNQALTLAKHSKQSLENELVQAKRQLTQSDMVLASTQKSLDKAVEIRRKKEKEAVVLEKKLHERDIQISKLCSSLRQLRAFFHAIENMDAADAAGNPTAPKKSFQFGRILQELDKLGSSIEGLQ